MKQSPTHVIVTVSKARRLLATDRSGKCNLFVTVELGEESFSTATVENTNDPCWLEECAFEFPGGKKKLSVKLWDDNGPEPEMIGGLKLELENFISALEIEKNQ
eukprot:Colp12_sorted_trinity150504_noHs@22381